MDIRVGFEMVLRTRAPTPLVLALSPHTSFSGRIVGPDTIRSEPQTPHETFIDPFGNRRTRLVAPVGVLRLWSDDIVEVDGKPDVFDWDARQVDPSALPVDTLPFLTASRYCESDALSAQAWALFGATPPGWARVQAICNFVHNHLSFGYQFGRPTKTAGDAMRERTGVCRDFAHLAVALCRSMNVPARYAAGYLGDIGVPHSGPGDFCAWFEAWLGDRWYTFDARYNTPRIGRVLMVRGRDAADAAMVTSFGDYDLELLRVWSDEVAPGSQGSDRENSETLLGQLPEAPALTLAPTACC